MFWVKPLPAEAAPGRVHEAPSGSSLSHFFFSFFLFLRKEVEKAWRTQWFQLATQLIPVPCQEEKPCLFPVQTRQSHLDWPR